ncbi:MAG: hypothetical protein WD231_04700 [Candidatus Woykebacteria bacterium]
MSLVGALVTTATVGGSGGSATITVLRDCARHKKGEQTAAVFDNPGDAERATRLIREKERVVALYDDTRGAIESLSDAVWDEELEQLDDSQ